MERYQVYESGRVVQSHRLLENALSAARKLYRGRGKLVRVVDSQVKVGGIETWIIWGAKRCEVSTRRLTQAQADFTRELEASCEA